MALFGKLLGGGDKDAKPEGDAGAKPQGASAREHERVSADGSTVTIMSTGKAYPLNDISAGGLSIKDYDGTLRGNQYFQFKFSTVKNGAPLETEAMAIVVRVKDGQLAAKFPPQPRLREFLKEFFS